MPIQRYRYRTHSARNRKGHAAGTRLLLALPMSDGTDRTGIWGSIAGDAKAQAQDNHQARSAVVVEGALTSAAALRAG
jgi:hypothetical protein